MENKKFFTYTLIAACLICLVAVYFRVFTDMELPGRIMAAILGVVITASITQLLLEGQTEKELRLKEGQANNQRESDEKQKEWQENQTRKAQEWQDEQARKAEEWRLKHDRSNVVFGEKLKIYQKFLDTLYNAVKDGELTESEKLELQYQTSLVAMHCEPENIQKLSGAVNQVITVVCEPSKKRSPNENALLKTLFDVVEALRKDLYAKDFKPFPNDVKEQTIGNFNAAYSKAKKGDEDEGKEAKQHLLVDLNVLSDVNHAMLNSSKIEGNSVSSENKAATVVDQRKYNTLLWEQAVERWTKARWTVASLESEECPLQITRNDGNPGMIDMGFYDNHYYIQARYEGDWNFSKCLKWDNGGRRQREFWWEYPPLAMDVPRGSFISRFKSSPELQQYIIKRVDYLMGVLQKEHRTIQWMNAVGEHKDWNLFTWYWSTLACEYQNDEEGKVYMDTMPDENDKSKVIVQLGNRANNVEMLKKTLKRIGCPEKIETIEKADCYVKLATINSLEPEMVGKELNEWIGKISKKQ